MVNVPPTSSLHSQFVVTVKVLAAVVFACSLHACSALATSASPASSAIQNSADKAVGEYAEHRQAEAAVQAIAQAHRLAPEEVRKALAQARKLPAVIRAAAPPPASAPKNWAVYRARLVDPQRIRQGVAFWNTHHATLSRAERSTGVPATIIVGILGIETLYGQHMGNYRVLDALATLAFDFPDSHPRAAERRAFFLEELGHFLRLCRDRNQAPTQPLGSYAGAMGLPQFMPSSWLRYAIDFDGDGRIDLHGSAADAIGSVARYLQAYGWLPGVPTHFAVQLQADPIDRAALLQPDIVPSFTLDEFRALGATPALPSTPLAQRYDGKFALVQLDNGTQPPSFVAGTQNFYVLTRYNRSSYYAMAVIELGNAVARAVGTAGAAAYQNPTRKPADRVRPASG
ncbi:lytic murein transglycosylase B [Candidatus Symbiobacter mobilis]|uniref:Membrane-bound lytic murein transglycosylase B n=1 Tax=Candidatus Symbiobacter mobilis CR TaxID=946483 RepID=U5N874_9BURK|nr:lytic murein transglycosylase B [Candidatus Symbiobacter mobilis]AGX86359.1 membrane-bound lytic murein transglycosylase B [Candidatus Symbiobacter mobilis CR]